MYPGVRYCGTAGFRLRNLLLAAVGWALETGNGSWVESACSVITNPHCCLPSRVYSLVVTVNLAVTNSPEGGYPVMATATVGPCPSITPCLLPSPRSP